MPDDPDQLLTSHEVAAIFRVNERTVRRWRASGELADCTVRTPGGHLRYRADLIRARANPPKTSAPVYAGKPGCPCGGWGTHICPAPPQTSAPGNPLTIPTPGADPKQAKR